MPHRTVHLNRIFDDDDGTSGLGGQQTIDFHKTLSTPKDNARVFLSITTSRIKPEKVNPAAHFELGVPSLDTLKMPATHACITKALTAVFQK